MNRIKLLFKYFEVLLLNKIIKHKFVFYIGNSEKDLDDIYKLRYNVYCKEFNYLRENDYKDKKEKDKYDNYSIHFIIRDREGNIAATSRLILNSHLGFPLENNFKLFFDTKKIPRNELAEISRLIILPKYRNQTLMILLIRGMFSYVRENNIDFIYSVLDDNLAPRLKRMHLPFHQIGNSTSYQGITTPFIFDVNEFANVLKESNPVLWDYLKKVDPVSANIKNFCKKDSLVYSLMKNND